MKFSSKANFVWVAIGAMVVGCMTKQERQALEREENIRLVRKMAEDAKRQSKQRLEQYWKDLAEHNYNYIQARYADGKKVINRYHQQKDGGEGEDCLSKWVGPRLPLSQDEMMRGRAIIEEFGGKYLPATFSRYEKAREVAEEIQQMFNESFPEPWTIRSSNPEWDAYCKLLRGLSNARTKYLRRHDELCHFYIMHKVGATTVDDLAKFDAQPNGFWLLEENGKDVAFPVKAYQPMDNKVSDFASKYMPEIYASYLSLDRECAETRKLYEEVLSDMRIMDAVRFDLGMISCCEKMNYIADAMTKISAKIGALYMDHKIMEKDQAAITTEDHKLAMYWKDFVELMPGYVKNRANGPLIMVGETINKYYPSCDVLHWHLWALGFPTGKRSDMNNAFKTREWHWGSVCGDVMDSVCFANLYSEDYFEMEKGKYTGEYRDFAFGPFSSDDEFRLVDHTSEFGYGGYEYRLSNSEFENYEIRYIPFKRIWNQFSQWEDPTKDVLHVSSYVAMMRYVKPEEGGHLIVPPFEVRLNEFSGAQKTLVLMRYGKSTDTWWKVDAL